MDSYMFIAKYLYDRIIMSILRWKKTTTIFIKIYEAWQEIHVTYQKEFISLSIRSKLSSISQIVLKSTKNGLVIT